MAVEGQIFIVTKGQQAIKLALVKTSALPEKEIQAFIDRRRDSFTELATLGKAIEEKKNDINKIKRETLNPLNPAEPKPFTEFEKLPADDCKQSDGPVKYMVCSPAAAAIKRRKTTLQEQFKAEFGQVDGLRAELREMMKKHRETATALRTIVDQIFAVVPPLDAVKTDADGKFSLTVPANQKFAVVANSRRDVADKTEYYQWAVWHFPKKGSKNFVTLANDNLLETHCDDCVQLPKLSTYFDIGEFPENVTSRYDK